ncbi:MAG: hypothetical protein H6668_17165 [Ardenticatenaceae bacterium]|nr:hypothetical protein [Ardenticatenaceae bacterium]
MKAILFNVFGGIVRGDIVARGIVAALNELQTNVPMVVRLLGTNSAEGRQILAEGEHGNGRYADGSRWEGRCCRE